MLICDFSTTHKYGKMSLDIMLEPYSLCWQEMVVLLALDGKPDSSQSLLTVLLQTDKGNVSKLLHKMEKKALLFCKPGILDKRQKDNVLTYKAQKLIPEVKKVMTEWESFCFRGLSPKEIELFSKISQVVFKNTMDLIGSSMENAITEIDEIPNK